MRPTDRPRPLAPSVVIDASALSSVAAGSGIGTYVRNLVAALATRSDTDLSARSVLSISVLVEPNVVVPAGIGRRPIRRRCKQRARAEVIEHAIRLPWDDRRHRDRGEVFHEPGFHAPWGIRHPKVQTLHDVIPLVLDEPDVGALAQRWRRFGPRYRQADAVIAVSRHAADEGIRILGLDPTRIFVAHHGVDPAYGPGDPADRGNPPYLLIVGEYSRRKGFGEAFEVIDALAEAGYPHRLKVAGRIHDFARDELEGLRAAARHPERIELLGRVPDLATLYRRATAVLLTTRYEGFGLPAVEAMACGTPVVAFANTAVAEVVEGGGVLVADADVAAMVAALRSLLDNPAAAEELRQRGLVRASQFSWAKSAAIHAEVYRLVAEGIG